ncbi:clathrin coat assembly protein AP180-like [Macadamia integrifolia]|uniref:clathrin coat assembly protein AP180-like n=1 Tax=Macadamia integrifolia TaxID=60698 RepID=UPI001C530341|nr:clathrin coat assembly protein AP180-like [Macadamia integrifolia]
MSSKLRKAIGAVKDQTSLGIALVAKNNSSNLDIAVLKATTHDAIPVDEKYLIEILQLTSSSKHYAAACAQAIAKRIGRTRKWIVALKSLMLVLRIFQDGDPHFPREVLLAMKRGAKILNLSSFRDDSNSSPWDYTAYVRTFALYLDKRLEGFLTGKLQRRAVYKEQQNKRSNDRRNESVCDMKPPVLLDRISHWQCLLDRAIATRPTGAAKSNRLVQISLYAIVRESFDLYRDISDGLALLLDSFFHLQYKSCSAAFEACIKASKQFDELCGFYTLCKNIGVGRSSEYPSVNKISDELIDTLREFLKDQASFPSGNLHRPPLQPAAYLLLPAPSPPPPDCCASTSGRLEHCEQQSDEGSDLYDRRASLEDLMSVMDAGTSPSISTDFDQFEKQSQIEDFARLNMNPNEAGTALREMDLVIFSDDDQQPSVSAETEDVGSEGREGWELVLAETASDISSSSQVVSGFEPSFLNSLYNQVPVELQQHMSSSSQAGSGFEPSFLGSLYNEVQAPVLQLQQPIYNPFLQDTSEIDLTSTTAHPQAAIVPVVVSTDAFSSSPTFEATPTFCAQNSNDAMAPKWPLEDDPFAPFPSQIDPILDSSTNQQQHLQREQQLWLQNQNEIIARHVNIT